MKRLAVVLCITGAPAAADLFCSLTDASCQTDCAETSVRFSIDASQFVAPQDPSDPPRRQVSDVTMGDRRFYAQAIMMDGGIVGFHETASDPGSALMIVQSDGYARLTLEPENRTLLGTCITTD
jgi:hypothetical protein